jgi:RIO-like serine/threonine protein kinase
MTGMSAIETAKEIVRITSTAGLSKDVIDLLEKKNALLAEQITSLETENANLKEKITNLQQQLDRLCPKENGLDETEVRFLQLLTQRNWTPIESIAAALSIAKVKAEYHRDVLTKARLIRMPMVVQVGYETYGLTEAGRAYLAKRDLI